MKLCYFAEVDLWPIVLTSNLSKALERCILIRSTGLASLPQISNLASNRDSPQIYVVLKNVVSKYLHSDSDVFGCFLDASKAFDRVNHTELLMDRNVPCTVLRFLFSWYKDQKLAVRCNSNLSDSFGVTNDVRQGSVLSPVLFSVYIDELLLTL